MSRLLAVSLVIILATGLGNAKKEDFVRRRDEINKNPAKTWKAELSAGIPYDDDAALNGLLGAVIDPSDLELNENKEFKAHNEKGKGPKERHLQTNPVSYDLRVVYPDCLSLKNIRNQSRCGSCWVVSTINSLSDRHCIKAVQAGALSQRNFSFQDVLECCTNATCGTYSTGCSGGLVTRAFNYAKTYGVVTGDGYDVPDTCKPYFLPSPYPSNLTVTLPACRNTCSDPLYPRAYPSDIVKTNGYLAISKSTMTTAQKVEAAKAAIVARGTIVATFTVFDDFYVYKSGVYIKSATALQRGGHAVRVIGWGVDPVGGPYWIAANSWGTNWGQGGYFWIKQGTNHCGFEGSFAEGIML